METVVLRIDELDPAQNAYPVYLLPWPPTSGVAPAAPAAFIDATLTPPATAAAQAAPVYDAAQMRTRLADAAGPDAALLEIGAQLYALLAQGDVANAISTRDRRIVLDIRPALLRTLPWELLWRPADQFPQFGDLRTPFCRGSLVDNPPPAIADWPVRLMIAIGSRSDDPAVRAEQELEQVMTALTPCDPDVDVLLWKRRGKANLVEEIQRFKPHILHFIGHGQVQPDGQAALELLNETNANAKERWEPKAIRTDALPDSLRLVVVNACRSDNAGQAQAINRNGLWSVTDAFLVAGVPAVLGMRTDVAGEDAAHFAAAFYRALAEGVALDIAVARARQAVYQGRPDGLRRREWAAPCLQVCCPPDQILRIGGSIPDARRQQVLKARDFRENRQLVDRRPERRQAWQDMATEERSLLVIDGPELSGKTRFASLLMERCALFGHDVRYVDLDAYMRARSMVTGADFLTVLRAIRDGDIRSKPLLSRPLPADKFAAFNRTVNRVLGAQVPAGQEDQDQGAALGPDGYLRGEELIVSFRDCLAQSVVTPPLVIVLDHLAGLTAESFTDYLRPYLLDWCVGRRDIRIVLLLTSRLYANFCIEDMAGDYDRVSIPDFDPAEWVDLAIEYLRRTRPNEEPRYFEQARNVLAGMQMLYNINGPWKPKILKKLDAE